MYKVSYFVFAPDIRISKAGVTVNWICKAFRFEGNFLILDDAIREGSEERHLYVALQPKGPVTIDKV